MKNHYINNLELTSCDNYENYQTDSTKKETSNQNNNIQLLQNKEIKTILDSEFYLIRKINESPSGKVYLGIHKDSLKEKNDDINYYSIKLIDAEKIDLFKFKNEIEISLATK